MGKPGSLESEAELAYALAFDSLISAQALLCLQKQAACISRQASLSGTCFCDLLSKKGTCFLT